MAAGTRRCKIIVQKPTYVEDGSRQPVPSWTAHCTRLAEVLPTGGAERIRGRQVAASMTHVIDLIADTQTRAITPGMRVLWGARVIDLVSCRPLYGQRKMVELQGVEAVQI